MSDSLERLLDHDLRLDLLCCLTDESLSEAALCVRVDLPLPAMKYHLRLLAGIEVVSRFRDEDGGDVMYAAVLDRHAPWVTEAVEGRREGRPRPSATVRAVVGMQCDSCERLFEYRSQVVAVFRVGGSGSLRAKLISEDTPGSGEAARLHATAKFHPDCYPEVRNRNSSLPPID